MFWDSVCAVDRELCDRQPPLALTSLMRIMMHLTIFLPKLSLGSLISTVLGVALTDVALLFRMPLTNEFTTAARVVVFHALYDPGVCRGARLRRRGFVTVDTAELR